MLSGKSMSIPVQSITVLPDRQRKTFESIDSLAASISKIGLLNPLVVTPEYVLVAGERRLRAITSLGWSHVEVRLTTDLEETDLQLIELEENVQREDLSWTEQALAIHKYVGLLRSVKGEVTQEEIADNLNMSGGYLHRWLRVAEGILADEPLLRDCTSLTTAHNILLRKDQRASAAMEATIEGFLDETAVSVPSQPARQTTGGALGNAGATVAGGVAQPTKEEVKRREAARPDLTVPMLHTDFHKFVTEFDMSGRPKFNFLHCDFPYGINYDKHAGGATDEMGGYKDSPDVYWNLLSTLKSIMSSHVAESAHIMFWLSARIEIIESTMAVLEEMGWKMNPVPLIWFRSDNSGILPDPKRGPRQVYEVALMGSRGDRFVAQAVANLFAHPKTKEFHASEKPKDMLRHFFRMFVDDSTVMLDPTMGSGNSVIVAKQMGAREVLGIERDKDFHTRAKNNWTLDITAG